MSVRWEDRDGFDLAVCERCGGTYIPGTLALPMCPECRERHRGSTRPVAPDLYDKRDIAQFRPGGSFEDVWARIRAEVRYAANATRRDAR